MSRNRSSGRSRLDRRRRYRRSMIGAVVVGVLGALALRFLGYPLVGEAVYWAGVLAFLAVWLGTSTTLFDERDRALERRASAVTLTLCAVALVVGASAARVLPLVGSYRIPPLVAGALYGYAALFVVFGAVYLWFRFRR